VDLGQRERQEGAWATTAGVLAPGLNRVAYCAFEFEFLQIFEYNLTKL
jgi:hypothetical protein